MNDTERDRERLSDGCSGEPPLRSAGGRDRVTLGEDDGSLALLVDGVVQSIAVDKVRPGSGYWTAMLPDAKPRNVLILGLGAGTIARLLVERFGPLPIVGVEREPRVVELGRSHFGLDMPNLEIVVADAFQFVGEASISFDLICVDLYDGIVLARGVTAKPFLRRVKDLLTPTGAAHFNLVLSRRLPRQLRRLGEIFRIVSTAEADFNLVVRCRRS